MPSASMPFPARVARGDVSAAWAPPGPVDWFGTLGVQRSGRGDPTVRLRAGSLWWATRTPDGPGTLHARARGDEVVADAWGPGATWLVGALPRLFGAADDPTPLVPRHPAVARAARARPHLRLSASGLVLPGLVAAILGQRVTGGEASRSWAGLCRAVGGVAPGPAGAVPGAGDPGPGFRLHLPPDPEVLAGRPAWWFHRFGVEAKRADAIRRVSARAGWLQAGVALGRDGLAARLQHVPGVGAWTTALVLDAALGDPDAVPLGDYHVPHQVAWNLAREPRGSDERMLELLAPYAGQRGRVVRLVVLEGRPAPKFGPRRRVLPIARL